ncbi:MAG: type II secretion system protein GspG [Blastocatellia bacterium]|nr:type II secretion system protein GspG [Blastocatellia bacterium]MCS7156722.1 type II secretion system protein GspG [Blastocatellia bacterium]MCX7751536.1 type II secretion system protein GspG [Blastocatellia bacterium]MDW8168636.1 type II secretion system protein GspG [Acidobacteriota bacterium]MDW8256531.1 type II secretion system protein GspG [Acidobacteriota bacterium]
MWKKGGVALALVGAFLMGAWARGELSPGEARRLIATVGGIQLPKENVHVRRIDRLGGRDAVVEAFVLTAFKFTRRDNEWEVTEVRVGDRQWESVELVTTAVRAEKTRRTIADLREVAAAVEAFRKERGFYPSVADFVALVDQLTPTYLKRVIREDWWHRPFLYAVTARGYRLESLGPDGKPGTGDEIILENGELVAPRPVL